MTTMRERLIAAIDREANRYIREFADGGDWADVPYELFVDAVLDELEQPSEGMVNEGYLETPASADMTRDDFRIAFTAAISAAREGK